jgi:PAS domain S-box-containing protein
MNKDQKHLTWEAVTWIFIIVLTILTIVFFPWYLAENMLKVILAIAVTATIFWYFKSRQLYLMSQDKSKKILASQRELRNRQKTIDLIYEHSADGVLILDSEQRIESFSPGLAKITGYSEEETLGLLAKQVLKFRASKDESLLPDLMFLPRDLKKHPYAKNYLTTKDGREITIEASYTSIKKDGESKALAIIRDITYEEDLVERDKEFVAVTSHQMNTPLSIMRGYLSLILSGKAGKVSPTQKQYLEEIYTGTKKLITLTQSLLSISRIEQDKVIIEKKEIPIKKFMETLKQNTQFESLSKGVSLTVAIPPKEFLFYADEEKLSQALVNLVDNSTKYTKKGKITVTSELKGDNVFFYVTDSGIGIPDEDIVKIGQKFYRSQNAINIDNKGTGLGLFITRTIIEKHNGSIKIDSKLNSGTEITIRIPRI